MRATIQRSLAPPSTFASGGRRTTIYSSSTIKYYTKFDLIKPFSLSLSAVPLCRTGERNLSFARFGIILIDNKTRFALRTSQTNGNVFDCDAQVNGAEQRYAESLPCDVGARVKRSIIKNAAWKWRPRISLSRKTQ